MYERPSFFLNCIKSVNEQNYSPIEVIIIDDASTTNFCNILNNFYWKKNLTVKYKKLKKNLGNGGAKNRGIQLAKGEYIAILDSDDYWKPEYLSEHVNFLKNNPEISISYSDYYIKNPKQGIRVREYEPYSKILPNVFDGINWIQASSRVWRRIAIKRVGPMVNYRRSSDVNQLIRAGCLDLNIGHIPKILGYYSEDHGQNQITKTQDNFIAKIEEMKSLIHAAKFIFQTRKHKNAKNLELMSKMYLNHTISLLLLNERYFSKEGLVIVTRIGYNISNTLFAFIGFIFISLEASPILIGKILRKLNLH